MNINRNAIMITIFFAITVAIKNVVTIYAQDAKKIYVVTQKSFPVDSIEEKEIEWIFLGKTTKIKDLKISIVTLKEGDVHKLFLKDYLNKTESQYEIFWKKLVFTGKGKMPVTVKNDKEVIDFVKKNEGAIGYIGSTDDISEDVKVIEVKKKNN